MVLFSLAISPWEWWHNISEPLTSLTHKCCSWMDKIQKIKQGIGVACTCEERKPNKELQRFEEQRASSTLWKTRNIWVFFDIVICPWKPSIATPTNNERSGLEFCKRRHSSGLTISESGFLYRICEQLRNTLESCSSSSSIAQTISNIIFQILPISFLLLACWNYQTLESSHLRCEDECPESMESPVGPLGLQQPRQTSKRGQQTKCFDMRCAQGCGGLETDRSFWVQNHFWRTPDCHVRNFKSLSLHKVTQHA